MKKFYAIYVKFYDDEWMEDMIGVTDDPEKGKQVALNWLRETQKDGYYVELTELCYQIVPTKFY